MESKSVYYFIIRLLIYAMVGTVLTQLIGSIGIEMLFKNHGTTSLVSLGEKYPDSWYFIRILQLINSVFTFLIPSLIVWKLFSGTYNFFNTRELRSSKKAFLFIPILLISFFPLVQALYVFNLNIDFPEPLQSVFMQMEEQMNSLIKGMLQDYSIAAITMNVFIIVIVAAFLEEIFFRGVLQRILTFYVDPHIAILFAAFFFSAIHMQFFGFLPRFALGILFGYMYWKTNRLMVPIMSHLIFNGLQLASYYWTNQFATNPNPVTEQPYSIWITVPSIIIFFILYYIFHNYFTNNATKENGIE